MVNNNNNIENIQYMEYGSDVFGTSEFGGQGLTTGDLKISSIPSGTRIWLAPSGQTLVDQGVDTILGGQTISNLDIGNYDIKLVLIDYIDWTTTVSVTAGLTTEVVATLVSAPCPTSPRYSGNSINLQASPNGAIGPYYVRFWRKPTSAGSMTWQELGTTRSVSEGSSTSTSFTLYDLDVASAIGHSGALTPDSNIAGTISESGAAAALAVGKIRVATTIYDSCPITPQVCLSYCDVTLGCVAPTCNFTVI
jgi:hypothetical protein